jgi:chaperone modulatory protein CbpM
MKTALTFSEVCDYFRVDIGLVTEFAEFGLYPTVLLGDEVGIETSELERLEKVISLHQALGINKEGIEAVLGLRTRISELEAEVELCRGEVLRLRRRLEAEDPATVERLGLLIRIDSLE